MTRMFWHGYASNSHGGCALCLGLGASLVARHAHTLEEERSLNVGHKPKPRAEVFLVHKKLACLVLGLLQHRSIALASTGGACGRLSPRGGGRAKQIRQVDFVFTRGAV